MGEEKSKSREGLEVEIHIFVPILQFANDAVMSLIKTIVNDSVASGLEPYDIKISAITRKEVDD